ncbi:hypothetical protein [Superficieibacter sp.]|uniref:hypothetical protein n=1 Tax=Superficieibacter sp. TaxID=2303322 RepID=UPI0028A8FA54|nr:hypothetical protein [Superficieibacter sp.]
MTPSIRLTSTTKPWQKYLIFVLIAALPDLVTAGIRFYGMLTASPDPARAFMNSFDLTFLKYLQDHSPLPVDEATRRFGKTLSTLKRTMKELNELLPADLQLHQDNHFLVTRMGYADYVNFLQQVRFNRYLTAPDERVRDLFVALSLNDVVNKSEYYRRFFVSPGTLKNDNPVMALFLRQRGLALIGVPRRGSQLTGDEFQLRVAACMTILKTVEVDENNRLIAHQASEPANRSIAEQFLTACATHTVQAAWLYETRICPAFALSYNGKKYFLVYMSLTLQRIARGWRIENTTAAGFISTFAHRLLDDPQENAFLDLVLASLSFTRRPATLYDPALAHEVNGFCQQVEQHLAATLHDRQRWFTEVYAFLHAAIVQNKFNLWFDDKKLHDVQAHYSTLWQHTQHALGSIEQRWQIRFSAAHLATLVLIVKKFELRNRVLSERRKRVIIVTNSSESKVGYFKEVLRSWFHIEIPECVNINEIERLKQQPFDLLITFTNKISSYLKYHHLDYVKVNFHLTQDDITLLRQCGLSRARKKIPVGAFVEQIQGMDGERLRAFLEQHYADLFI